MPELTTTSLIEEIYQEALLTKGEGFTLAKELGTVAGCTDAAGAPRPDFEPSERLNVEMNAAAVRLLKERIPVLNITYPQTKLSERPLWKDGEELTVTRSRIDAVIEVPEAFVQEHCGFCFQEIMREKWSEQLNDLTEQIAARLRKHEMRTEQMFGKETDAAAMHFTVTEDTAESEIWTVSLRKCGLYPLQWDGEICGMALLLAEKLKAALAQDCGSMLETAVQRDEENHQCAVRIYYSFKQD